MKKTLFTLGLVFMSAVFAYSQTDQGTMYLGGSLNFGFGSSKEKAGSTTVDGPKTFNFGINPALGYFISDNFMLGLGIGYDMESYKEENYGIHDEYKVTTSAFNVGPFVRYYMMPVKNAGIFVQGNVAVGFGKVKTETTDDGTTTSNEMKLSAFTVGVTPGIVFFVSDMVSFEATFGNLSFTSATDKQDVGDDEYKDTQSQFNLEINPAYFTFGVGIHL